MNRSTTIAITVALTSSVVFAACQASPTTLQTQPAQNIPQTAGQTTPVVGQSTTTTTTSATAKTVSVNTSYQSDGGTEQVAFHVSVDANGLITNTKTDVLSNDPRGVMHQTAFANALTQVVIGKKLSDLGPLDRVAGSSLTTAAFNDALAQLKAQL